VMRPESQHNQRISFEATASLMEMAKAYVESDAINTNDLDEASLISRASEYLAQV